MRTRRDADQLRDLRQEHRHEVGAPVLHRFAHVGADEEGGVAEAVLELRPHVGRGPERQQVDDLVVGEVLAVCDQRLDQRYRLGGARADQDAPAGTDGFEIAPRASTTLAA